MTRCFFYKGSMILGKSGSTQAFNHMKPATATSTHICTKTQIICLAHSSLPKSSSLSSSVSYLKYWYSNFYDPPDDPHFRTSKVTEQFTSCSVDRCSFTGIILVYSIYKRWYKSNSVFMYTAPGTQRTGMAVLTAISARCVDERRHTQYLLRPVKSANSHWQFC